MKKILIILVTGAFICISFNSCSKKCGHCNTNGSSGTRYCSSENHITYDAAVSSCATGGGTWVRE